MKILKNLTFGAILLLLVPAFALQGQLTYTTNNGGITITRYTGTNGAVAVPGTITGLPVTVIGSSAFHNCTNLGSVTLPDSVTDIDIQAFAYCTALTNIVFPTNLASIYDYAFINCTNLAAVTLPSGLGSIADGAFGNCSRLVAVTIPASVNSIGTSPFDFCTDLTSITVSSPNPSYNSLDGVLFDSGQTTLIQYPAGRAGAYTIPDSVISIGDSAFMSSAGLTSVVLSTNLSSIGNAAFFGCGNLTGVAIPQSVTSIGSVAFAACSSLRAITVDSLNPAYASVGGVLLDKTQTTLIECPAGKSGIYTVPGSVTSLGDNAFDHCTNLTGINIPNSVTNIGNSAFYFCANLTNIVLPNSVTTIGVSAFYGCTSLANITLPVNLTSIKAAAFLHCADLTNISISATVTNIDRTAFSACTSLAAINIDPANAYYTTASGVLFNKGQDTVLFCPEAKAGAYVLPAAVTNIGPLAFAFCPLLTRVTIPACAISLGTSAFASCGNVTGFYFEGNAPSLGSTVFSQDSNATVYYLSGASGWSTTFGGLPASPWKPEIQTGDVAFGVRANQLGFNVTWARSMTVVVDACVNLAHPIWIPLGTNILASGSFYFTDANWTNYPNFLKPRT